MTNDFEFEVTGGKAAVKRYTGSGGNVVIPARTPDGTEVTALGKGAFFRCIGLTAVTIPDGVTVIGEGAFCGCRSLTGITIPESVKEIGSFAFSGCTGIKEVTLPAGVTGIGSKAFSGCTSLIRFRVPDEASADWNGLLEAMDHPAASKASVYMPLTLADGVLFSGDGKTLVLCFPGKEGRYCVPAGVTGIGPYAFWNCTGLTEIILPDGVVTIGEGAFHGCGGLTSMTIPDSVASIGEGAFGNPWKNQAFGHLWKLTAEVSRDSYARKYCEQEFMNYRYPEEEKVRPCLADGLRAYAEYVFHRFELEDEADTEYTVWSVRFLELCRRPDGKTGLSYLENRDYDLRIREADIGTPCPDTRKRVEAYFQNLFTIHEGWNDWPQYERNLLDEMAKVNASVYEVPDSVRSDRLGDPADALLIQAAGLWYYMEYTETDLDF